MKIFSVLSQIILITSVYLFGRYNFSFGWILPVLVSAAFDESRRNREVDRAIRMRTAALDQQQVIMTSFDEVPAWVMFPDVERAEWINKIVRHLWPDLKDLVEQVLKDFEPKIQRIDYLSGFKFSKIDFGTITPQITGVKVQDQNLSVDETLIELEVFYFGDAELTVSVNGIEGGVKNLQAKGTLRVGVRHVATLPFICGVNFSFLSPPKFDYELTNTLAALNMFGVDEIVHNLITNEVLKRMVFPKKIEISMKNRYQMRKIAGVVHIEARLEDTSEFDEEAFEVSFELGSQVAEAEVVAKGDTKSFTGNLVQLTGFDSKIKVIVKAKRSTNSANESDISLTDKGSKHFKTEVDISELDQNPVSDSFKLKPSGLIFMDVSYCQQSRDRKDLNCLALFELFIDSVRKMPREQKQMIAKVSIGNEVKQFFTDENKPQAWKKYAAFFINDPKKQVFTVQVIEQDSAEVLGNFEYKMKDLMQRKNMEHGKQAFQLKNTTHNSEIVMSLRLTAIRDGK